MYEKTYNTEQGTLYYVVKEERVTITSYHGNDVKLRLPEQIEGIPVSKIGKKAFLNSRRLQHLILPETVKKLGEWALAYCAMLETVELPKRRIAMGKGCFLGDKRLRKLKLYARDNEEGRIWKEYPSAYREDVAVLLAALAGMEDAEYLLDTKAAGSAEWIKQWDLRLMKWMQEPDEKGYTQMILCGEEDISCSLEYYVRDRRKKKVRLAFLRLLHPSGLDEQTRTILEEYLISHSVGNASMETWLVLKEEKGHIQKYYELYVELGCLNLDNYDATLADLGEQHPEMKAYFMREHDANMQGDDFFSTFSL